MTKDKIEQEIRDFAVINGKVSKDEQEKLIVQCLMIGLNKLKFGDSPKDNFSKEGKPLEELLANSDKEKDSIKPITKKVINFSKK